MKTVLTQAQIDAMRRELEDQRPKPPGYAELDDAEQIVSLRSVAFNAFLLITLRSKSGDERSIVLNPVVARHLAATILSQGQNGGWLDDGYNIVLVPAPKTDA